MAQSVPTKISPPSGIDGSDVLVHMAPEGDYNSRGAADGLWEKGAGAISAAAVGGRVYHQAYSNKWVSYLFSARAKGVSQYQFRAPGEWFSEVYAVYQMGLMPENHPDAQAMSWIN